MCCLCSADTSVPMTLSIQHRFKEGVAVFTPASGNTSGWRGNRVCNPLCKQARVYPQTQMLGIRLNLIVGK
jgi:hypothetical protein